MKHVDGIAASFLLLLPSAFASASADVFHDITKAAARLCVLVCNPFARSAGIFFKLNFLRDMTYVLKLK